MQDSGFKLSQWGSKVHPLKDDQVCFSVVKTLEVAISSASKVYVQHLAQYLVQGKDSISICREWSDYRFHISLRDLKIEATPSKSSFIFVPLPHLRCVLHMYVSRMLMEWRGRKEKMGHRDKEGPRGEQRVLRKLAFWNKQAKGIGEGAAG